MSMPETLSVSRNANGLLAKPPGSSGTSGSSRWSRGCRQSANGGGGQASPSTFASSVEPVRQGESGRVASKDAAAVASVLW